MTPEQRAAALSVVYPALDGAELRTVASAIRQAEVDLLRRIADAISPVDPERQLEALIDVLEALLAERSR